MAHGRRDTKMRISLKSFSEMIPKNRRSVGEHRQNDTAQFCEATSRLQTIQFTKTFYLII